MYESIYQIRNCWEYCPLPPKIYTVSQACKFMSIIPALTRWSQDKEFKILHSPVKEHSSGCVRTKYNEETRYSQTVSVITKISQDDKNGE